MMWSRTSSSPAPSSTSSRTTSFRSGSRSEGIGPTFDRIRERLKWLGKPKREIGEIPKLWFPFETEAGAKRKLKVEINTHEHFAGVVSKSYAVEHPAATGAVEVPTHSLDELLSTKLRAYTQRDKGRDLFDLWWANEHEAVDSAEVVRLYGVYVTNQGRTPDSAPELRTKTQVLTRSHPASLFDSNSPFLSTLQPPFPIFNRWVERCGMRRRSCCVTT